MAKMVSLKNPPPKKETEPPITGPAMRDMYPYSTRLELSDDLARKFPDLVGANVGDQVRIEAIGTITGISENETRSMGDKKTKSDLRVTIQMTNATIKSDDEGEMDAGFSAGSSSSEE